MSVITTVSRSSWFIKACIALRKTQLRTVMQSSCHCSNKSPQPEDPEKPIAFSKSKAASWSAKSSFGGNEGSDMPWYQPLSISASIAAILIWFCVLREENDVDKELGKSLYERVDGLEKKQLELALIHNQGGVDTQAIKKRLHELNSKNLN